MKALLIVVLSAYVAAAAYGTYLVYRHSVTCDETKVDVFGRSKCWPPL